MHKLPGSFSEGTAQPACAWQPYTTLGPVLGSICAAELTADAECEQCRATVRTVFISCENGGSCCSLRPQLGKCVR